MTPAELRKILEAMTPGPWTTRGWASQSERYPGCSVSMPNRRWFVVDGESRDRNADNATGIAALRNAAEALVELWEAVEAMRDAAIDDDDAHSSANERAIAALARLREVKA